LTSTEAISVKSQCTTSKSIQGDSPWNKGVGFKFSLVSEVYSWNSEKYLNLNIENGIYE